MTRETWHIGLESARRRFESAATEYDDFLCTLFDWGARPEWEIRNFPLPPYGFLPKLSPLGRKLILYHYCPCDNGYLLGHREHYYGFSPPHCLPHHYDSSNQSEREGVTTFERCAADAMRCIGDMPDDVFGLLPCPSLYQRQVTTPDSVQWLWLLFDLAWNEPSGSSRRVERSIWGYVRPGTLVPWEDFFAFSHDQDEIRRWVEDNPSQAEQIPDVKQWAKELPDRFVSRIPCLFSWSIWAINILSNEAGDRISERGTTTTMNHLHVDLKTNEVIVGGEKHKVEPYHAHMLKSLQDAKSSGEWYVTGPTMTQSLPGCHGKNVTREMKKLKKQIPLLADLIVPEGTKGYRLAE